MSFSPFGRYEISVLIELAPEGMAGEQPTTPQIKPQFVHKEGSPPPSWCGQPQAARTLYIGRPFHPEIVANFLESHRRTRTHDTNVETNHARAQTKAALTLYIGRPFLPDIVANLLGSAHGRSPLN